MKDILDFVTWQWRKWENWQRVYFIGMMMIVIGFVMPGLLGALILVIGLTSVFSWLFKWAIWDSISKSFDEYKKEKNESRDAS